MFHFGPTWDIKDEERMEKLLYGAIKLVHLKFIALKF